MKAIVILFIFIVCGLGFSHPAAGDIYVVVNADNDFDESSGDPKTILRRLILKESENWPNGIPARAFLPKSGTPLASELLNSILELDDAAFEAHWARLKQTTGQSRPREVGSSRILLKLIARDPGAFGILEAASDFSVDGQLRIILKIP